MLRRATGISRICQQRAPRPSATAGQATQAGPSGSKTGAEGSAVQVGGPKSEHEKPQWQIHKEALRRNFPSGWNPPKKISRPAMALLRSLHRTDPNQFSLPLLADKFKISPEAVRRILKSKWEPDQDSLKKILDRQHSTGLPTSHDGWIHHEKLETDHIPLNLAHTLQSSPQQQQQQQRHSPEYSPIPTGTRAPSHRPHNGSFFRPESSRPSNRIAQDRDKTSENPASLTPDNKLGSAFQRPPGSSLPRRRPSVY